jgi:hypothetical protein
VHDLETWGFLTGKRRFPLGRFRSLFQLLKLMVPA